MAVGRQHDTWNHTSNLMALLATIHSDPSKGSSYTPSDFHPFVESPGLPEATPELLESLGFKRVAQPEAAAKPEGVSDGR